MITDQGKFNENFLTALDTICSICIIYSITDDLRLICSFIRICPILNFRLNLEM